MRIDVLTIFPQYLEPLGLSLPGKAIETGLVDLAVHDLRDWTHDRHRTVDDTPYGGGAGMVMKPEPWGEALDQLVPDGSEPRLLIMTPSGRPFTQALADELASEGHLILACGRYEGIDARVVEHAKTRMRTEEISIGDYVLNGGEVAALAIIESVVRLIPGVIGNPASLDEESHSSSHDRLLEYPVYTKPPTWRGLEVPEILFSGHHGKIADWRREQAIAKTAERRPELLPAEAAEVVITQATTADAGELFTLQRAAYVEEGRLHDTFDIPPLTQTFAELQASLAESTVLIARRQGRLIGSVLGTVEADNTWYIGRLMTAPDLHGQGIGSTLLDAIEALAPPTTETLRLFTGSSSAKNLRYYRQRGYTEVSRATHGTVQAVVLQKPPTRH